MMEASDLLIERPHEFSVNGRMFSIFAPSLGKVYLMQRLLSALEIDQDLIGTNTIAELLRLAVTQPKECCDLIAYATCRTKKDFFKTEVTEERSKFLQESLDAEEISVLLSVVLDFNRYKEFMEESGINKEQKRLADISRYKNRDSVVSCGGKTVWGQLIDPAMQRYGWTYDYTVWGISLAALELLMADKVTEVLLTEEDKKKMPKHLIDTGEKMSGDNPENWKKMMSFS